MDQDTCGLAGPIFRGPWSSGSLEVEVLSGRFPQPKVHPVPPQLLPRRHMLRRPFHRGVIIQQGRGLQDDRGGVGVDGMPFWSTWMQRTGRGRRTVPGGPYAMSLSTSWPPPRPRLRPSSSSARCGRDAGSLQKSAAGTGSTGSTRPNCEPEAHSRRMRYRAAGSGHLPLPSKPGNECPYLSGSCRCCPWAK